MKRDEMVSIIVPVYRAAAYIAKTIEMVQAQSYENWELLLVDDASPDESAAVIAQTLAEYGYVCAQTALLHEAQNETYQRGEKQPIRVLHKQKNEGAARARNTGLSAAQGRYIAFLDADDVWVPDKLEKQLAFMEKQQAGFVFSAYEFGDEEANPTGKTVHVPERLTYREALSRTVIFTTTVLIDREKIPDELIRMPEVESEDTATWWQILRAGHTACGLDEVLAVYRRPTVSLSSNKLRAVKRIWRLYRRQERLSVAASVRYFIPWAYRAAVRRL